MIYFILGIIVGILVSIIDILKFGRETIIKARKEMNLESGRVEIVDMRDDSEKLRDNFNMKP